MSGGVRESSRRIHVALKNTRQGLVRLAVAADAGPARPEAHPAALGFPRELRERKGERRALGSARGLAPRLHLADVPEEHGLQHQRVRAAGLRDLHVRGVGGRPRVRRVLLRHLERRQRLRGDRLLRVLHVAGEQIRPRLLPLARRRVLLDARGDLPQEVHGELADADLRRVDAVAGQELRAEAEEHQTGHRPLGHVQRGEQVGHQVLHQRLDVNLLRPRGVPPLEQLLPEVVAPLERGPVPRRASGAVARFPGAVPRGVFARRLLERHAHLHALHQHRRERLHGLGVVLGEHVPAQVASRGGQLEQRHEQVVEDQAPVLGVLLERGDDHVHGARLHQVHAVHRQRGDAQARELEHRRVREVNRVQQPRELRQDARQDVVHLPRDARRVRERLAAHRAPARAGPPSAGGRVFGGFLTPLGRRLLRRRDGLLLLFRLLLRSG
mmetsp:Transcript_11436/g.48752  ORF Transcript_11436/g.48752 Transcript_11436/m.48752 type:complete len:441 (-) Transcript_11436:1020-2342(-)